MEMITWEANSASTCDKAFQTSGGNLLIINAAITEVNAKNIYLLETC